jgi:hypothetical protein
MLLPFTCGAAVAPCTPRPFWQLRSVLPWIVGDVLVTQMHEP